MDFKTVMKSVWDISFDSEKHTTFGGVSVENNWILTSAAPFIGKNSIVTGCTLDEESRMYVLEMVYENPKLGLRVLKIKGSGDKFEGRVLSSDEKLEETEKVYHFGHGLRYRFSYYSSGVGSQCIEVLSPTFSTSLSCENHKKATFDREYGVVGNSFNIDTFKTISSSGRQPDPRLLPIMYTKDISFYKNLNPFLPTINCINIGGPTECCGTALFKKNGDIIGIHTFHDWCDVALHVSVLKAFMDEAKRSLEQPRPTRKERSTSSKVVKAAKRGRAC